MAFRPSDARLLVAMPWCDDCQRFWNPNSMPENGECPSCNRVIALPQKAPWHFKLLLVAVALYLIWRLVQLITWIV